MKTGNWEQAKRVVEAAADLPRAQQSAYVRRVCKGNEPLIELVLRLLSYYTDTTRSLISGLATFQRVRERVANAELLFAPGDILANRFHIEESIGRGGMGAVYRAHDSVLGIIVAIKTIRPEFCFDPDTIEQFKEEVRASLSIAHPNVCRVHDVGDHLLPSGDSVLFYSMELLSGETLAHRLLDQGRLGPKSAGPLLKQMAAGLEAAHEAGVIHRDFKPANVMLTPKRAVITDFGLATAMIRPDASSTSPARRVAGTPRYMAPEQFLGDAGGVPADIYALGLVAYEMITGHPAFDQEDIREIAFAKSGALFPRPKELVPDLPARWQKTILPALEPDPRKRPKSARQFLARLEAGPKLERRVAVVAIAGGIGWALTRNRKPPPPTDNPDALRLYEIGRHQLTERTPQRVDQAEESFRQALELDPQFGLAYSGLADCESFRADYGWRPARAALESAIRHAREGIRLAPKRAESHASLGLALSLYPWQGTTPVEAFETALRLDEDYALARQWYMTYRNRFVGPEDVLAELIAAKESDPTSVSVGQTLAWQYYQLGAFKEAIGEVEQVRRIEPGWAPGHAILALCYLETGRLERAVEEVDQISPDQYPLAHALRALAYARIGVPGPAEEQLAQLTELRGRQQHQWAFQLAAVLSVLGRDDQALEMLETADAERDCALLSMYQFPYFKHLYNDPRLLRIVAGLGLVPPPPALQKG